MKNTTINKNKCGSKCVCEKQNRDNRVLIGMDELFDRIGGRFFGLTLSNKSKTNPKNMVNCKIINRTSDYVTVSYARNVKRVHKDSISNVRCFNYSFEF
jgi:hypothetical protein